METHHTPPARHDIAAVRQFNRFHSLLVGALDEGLLASEFSLPQARLLYEIANTPAATPASAAAIGRSLRMDAGYLSRLLAQLETAGIVTRTSTRAQSKRQALSLTDHGRHAFAALNASSDAEVAALLNPLSDSERRQLVGAMARIRGLLGDTPPNTAFILRDPEPGDLGWVTHKQSALYANEYGWDWTFEGLMAEIIGQFVKSFDAQKERCWIAERDGQIVGSVFVVKHDATTAKLRMLYVDEMARGYGLGRRLVDECLRFARAKGYTRVVLWTNDVLVSARRIYQAVGFGLIEESAHQSFGKALIGQTWAIDL